MMPVAVGIAKTYSGELILAGGTQMLAVSAILKEEGTIPAICCHNIVCEGRSFG